MRLKDLPQKRRRSFMPVLRDMLFIPDFLIITNHKNLVQRFNPFKQFKPLNVLNSSNDLNVPA